MMFEGLKGKKYDHTLKWIAEQEPPGFFEWLMGEMGRQGFELKASGLSKELAPAPRQVDLVWHMLSPKGTAALLHIELQLEPDEGMGQRMLEYPTGCATSCISLECNDSKRSFIAHRLVEIKQRFEG